MGRSIIGLAAMLASSFSVAAAKPAVITQPDWIRRPKAEDLEQAYPQTALAINLEGFAAVTCQVDAFGRLNACVAAEESPADLGFGVAAVGMASRFEMRPKTADGAPVDGGTITIPIAFKLPLPEPAPAPAVAAAPTPQALALGRRYLAASQMTRRIEQEYAHPADEIEFTNDDAPATTRSDIAAALRSAIKAHAADLQEALAQDAAASFSEAELAAMVDALNGPAGAVIRPDADRDAVAEMLQREAGRRTRARAHDVFCGKYDCDPRAALTAPLAATIQQPIWSEGLSQGELDDMRPGVATSLGLPAAARLICRVGAMAKPEDCRVGAEAPAGLGIGQMVLPLASHYRLAPQLMAQGAQGESVVLTLFFDAPAPETPFNPPAPHSPAGLAIARQVIGYDPATTQAQAAGVVSRAMQAMPAGADRPVYADFTAAWAAGGREAADWLAEAQADTLAALATEQQLTAAAAYRASPLTKSFGGKFPSFTAAATRSTDALWAQIAAEAHDSFCRSHSCAVVRRSATASSAH